MSTQRKDQSRSAKLGLHKLWVGDADDAADRIVTTGFWTVATETSACVVAFPAAAAVQARPQAAPSTSAAIISVFPTVI